MFGKVFHEFCHRVLIAPVAGEQQAPLPKIVHQRDVGMAPPGRSLVDAQGRDRAEILLGPCRLDVMRHYPPR